MAEVDRLMERLGHPMAGHHKPCLPDHPRHPRQPPELTVVQIDNPDRPDYITELRGLLAPLLLMQLGNPDSITAYSVEDNRLSIREMLNLFVRVVFVVWILIRCWDSSSPVPFLYFPLFAAGIIRSAVTVWALKSVYWERSSISAEDIFDEETVGEFFNKRDRPRWSEEQKIILKAYYRFDCLKPHIVNWLYHPESLSISRLIVNRDLAFITTEVELGFMYDVLYTKQPVLYKPLGLIGRFTSFFCLVSALCGFAVIFKNAFLIDMYVTYTYVLLIGVTALECYQIVLQPFSAWVIVEMSRHQRNRPMLTRLLKFLAERYMKRKRWSNSVGQLDLLDHRLHDDWPWSIGRILKYLGKKQVTLRRYWIHSRVEIPGSLKELLVENIQKFNTMRDRKPFTERGNWTLEAHERSGDVEWTQKDLQVLKKNISTTFDKSIIIWHMATNICLLSEPDDAPNCKGSKLLSNYMIYLLALRPYSLSLTTTDITLEHACNILKPFLRYRDRNEALKTFSSAEKVLEPSLDQMGTIITKEWHVLLDAQELAATLKGKDNKWQIISSIWVEMLCYAAYSCQVYHHAKLLRRGGELITHVWLLLMHETDKYTHSPKTKPTEETKG
ncbi:uncharacterized protein LOC115679433 isoform X2 [Syzygium oleosum]|uniref:uncharacterized protein LOC115679433 isoform X2 n=1 Tax=Syzygium oleosum TaxID=219896 RepID=UPI0024B9F947|nr:uncharacterized protein LOC115679433 isoform X2 [Syzygium oleosum]XP_056166500.1 uncharacterized protein LOC115679433 isoform X2 [Syzygium oleosum]